MLLFDVLIHNYTAEDVGQRNLNRAVRTALVEAARHWLRRYMRMHFDRGASLRYGYLPRSVRYSITKNRTKALKAAGDFWGPLVARPQPPQDLVWRGTLRESLLGKTPDSFNMRTAVTATKQMVRVLVPLPHPMPERNVGELTVMTQEEKEDVYGVAASAFAQAMGSFLS